ncbi:MAG: hypothetical protein ACTSVS_09675 [Candidatus Heimdallarchaeota archaeon]
MVDRYYNPFQGIDISVPEQYREFFSRYCQTATKTSIDESPFPRMVDLWFFSVCIAMKQGLKPAELKQVKTYKIIEGSIFGSDPWRIHLLTLISVERSGSVEIVSKPRKMMAIANSLAVAGFAKVEEMLRDGDSDPIWNLSDNINEIFQKAS